MSSGSSSKAKRFKDSILHRSGSQSSSFTSVSVKDNAKAAWHGFKLVSKNVEKFLDGTPFKIPVGILNTLIGIADAVIDNRESMAILLLPIGQRLEIVSLGLETKRRPSGIDFTCERFSRVLAETVEDLGQMNEQGLLKRILASNEHPKQLDDIFRRVDEATKNFELELTLAIVREVEGIVQHAEILRLRDLRPSREARYADVQHDPCVQGTREEIIESVMCWCKDPSSDCPPIYWPSGMG